MFPPLLTLSLDVFVTYTRSHCTDITMSSSMIPIWKSNAVAWKSNVNTVHFRMGCSNVSKTHVGYGRRTSVQYMQKTAKHVITSPYFSVMPSGGGIVFNVGGVGMFRYTARLA